SKQTQPNSSCCTEDLAVIALPPAKTVLGLSDFTKTSCCFLSSTPRCDFLCQRHQLHWAILCCSAASDAGGSARGSRKDPPLPSKDPLKPLCDKHHLRLKPYKEK